ncbi:phage major capsid protein [Clostridium botulinum]|uniref:MAjor capsid protein a n=1 Tax=Clostridium botulinum (strain 657 / Type Ba4) TaxID=515621 RepID=A0A3F2ZUA9_CLOB6|nr:phage major capsid protein [Clostridium botulinum]ACQ54572.1 mAjor capsid protein a [Clostridium botulinum Ba4 str. 657]APU60233.1 phage major capsid protein, HK97 family [Clostridium botulinum]AXG91473.1 phage major capsid protein [Clostridium botulinum]NEZ80902.1 phage major capsid protein [Clostridium botulinum]NFA18273.1 phage major capsid protein [Clostridium botulinum]
MGMKNLDDKVDINEIRAQVDKALKEGDDKTVSEALVRMAQGIQENILKEAKSEARSMLSLEMNDRNVLNKRGTNTLTTEERKYYEAVIEKRGFTELEVTLPKTVFDRVFEELEQNHPLLSEITFQNTTAVTEWIRRTTDCEAAWWGALTDPIKKELSHGFDKVKTDMYKLSAFMPVSKAMLDLGPEWLDRYVRTVLSESISLALEAAIVAGTGKDQPIGMIKNLKGAVVDKVYPDKEAKTLTDFTPGTLGKEIMAPLTKTGKRSVPSVLILVNPLDYWEKIFSATTFLTQQGTYVFGVMPIPAKIVQTVAVPKGKLIAGMGKDYFMGVGSGQKIEFSDEYRFLEDERTYLAKQYATGEPKDNESFLVFDITNLNTEAPKTKSK